MTKKKIFIKLKNGQRIELYYKQSENITYTINLYFQDNLFVMHSYFMDGNDVFDESNYKDESEIEETDFDQFIKIITEKFPGIDACF